MWEKFEATLKARELTQKELAEMLGLPENRITKWKAQGDKIPVGKALILAKRLNMSLDYFVDDDVAEPVPSAKPALNKDEEFILDLVRTLGMSRKEAVLRLSGKGRTGKTTVRRKGPDRGNQSAG